MVGHEGVNSPEFRKMMITDLKRGTFHLLGYCCPPPLLEEYMVVRAPITAAASRAPSLAPTGASSVVTTRTGVPTLTTDSTRGTPAARVANPAPDPDFANITARQLLRERRPSPVNDAGSKFCVAWWIRSASFEKYGHHRTNVPFANTTKPSRLLVYCREHLAAPAASTATWRRSQEDTGTDPTGPDAESA